MEKYYTLCTLATDGVWYPQFGDYDRDVVKAEQDDAYEGQRTCIICTGPSQLEVDEGVAGLNMQPPPKAATAGQTFAQITNETVDDLASKTFGKSRSDGLAEKVCICCHESVVDANGQLDSVHFHSEAGRREFFISGLCERCFDAIFDEDGDDQ